jgi:hypothetical protein
MTDKAFEWDRSVMMSSVIPSAKRSHLGSSPIFSNGNTAIEELLLTAVLADCCHFMPRTIAPPPASRSMTAANPAKTRFLAPHLEEWVLLVFGTPSSFTR